MNIEIVTVVNKFDQYKELVTDNSYLLQYNKIQFDNSTDNIAITKRYNYYINNLLADNSWIIFCHQDFEFKENIAPKLQNLDTSCIYGPIGAKGIDRFSIYLRLDSKNLRKFRAGKTKRRFTVGEIGELKRGKTIKVGYYLINPELVDTIDCCCLIVHSSLIKKYNLRFDENLDWHSYSEDFSLNAKINFKIQTKAIQIDCIHYSSGSFNDGHEMSLIYLRDKYKNMPFASTCYDGYYYNFINRIKTEKI